VLKLLPSGILSGLITLDLTLTHFIGQNHHNYEIIIADDFSVDNTSDFVKKIDNEKGILRYYEVKQNKHGKKQALSEALTVATHKWVLLSDADCYPRSNHWITSMVDSITNDNIKIVLGYSPTKKKSSILSRWVHFETWATGLQYLSFAQAGLPYMGVGRNLLYDKTILKENTLSNYAHLSSGDDDLTIMQIATSENTAINLNPDSFVITEGPAHLKGYWRQKTRHYSTATSYKWQHQFLLGGYSLSQVLFYLLIIWQVFHQNWSLAMVCYGLRLILISPVVTNLQQLLEAEFNFLEFIIMDFLQAIYYPIFSFAVLFPQKNKW